MKNLCYLLVILGVFACGSPEEISSFHAPAKGDRVYGGTLKVNETELYASLFPNQITDAVSHSISNQIYDGLVRFNPRNITEVLPAIAERWDLDTTGRIYTFKLKKGVRFHDDPCFTKGVGREVTARDFLYSFEQLCTYSESNTIFESSFKGKVKGADAYYEASKAKRASSLEGVKLPDDYTVQITLIVPSLTFLYELAGPAGYVIPHEAIEKYGKSSTVGTGPFVFNSASTDERVILTRNPFYYRTDSLGNKLPFLDTVEVSFIPDKVQEFEAFKRGDIHLVFGLPSAEISKMMEHQIEDFKSQNPKYVLQRNPELTTQYYQFNVTRKPFDNVKVRQAFSYAIDRDTIISGVLHTEAFGPGICGFTPPGIFGYDITKIPGYTFNPQKAKKLLAEAGYPGGAGFPKVTLELNSGGGKHVAVAEEIQRQLKLVLNVNIDFVVVPFAQKLEDAKFGKADMFRAGWLADYASPENFLRTLYGLTVPDSLNKPSYPNTIRYKNPTYDSLLVQAFTARTQDEAFAYYMEAEKLMMQDAPMLILWYGESMKMMHTYVKNYYFNAMTHKDFSEVFILKTPVAGTSPKAP